MTAALPPALPPNVACAIVSAVRYDVPANMILAVAEREGGKPGQWVRNTNGTFDVGTMQFNTAYLATLRRWGITPAAAALPGCYPYDLAAWRLRGHLRHGKGDVWQRAADYHSRTPVHNAKYRAYLVVSAARWARWLSARMPTYEQGTGGAPAAPVAASVAGVTIASAAPGQYVPRSISVSSN